METDEAELVARVRAGASEAYAELVRRNQQQVFSILHRYERDLHLVEDLAQDTFTKAWRALGQFDGRAPFQHWLSRIAVHVALDHVRRRKRLSGTVALPELGEDCVSWLRDDLPPRELEARQAREILELAMHSLSAAEQLVITMLEIEGRSVKEICSLTGDSSVAVRVRAVRARSKLRKAIEQLQETENER
ncbi:MAG: sigma-70 family RNA polymerase sigma factor [Nibricoccus sp.]